MLLAHATPDPHTAQRRAQARLWGRRGLVRAYGSRTLRPPEVMALIRYRDELSGRVLELGCGAGRLAGYLAAMADDFHGIDVSPAMIAHCRDTYPTGRFAVRELRDVRQEPEGSYDAVFASFNILDVLPHTERLEMLGILRRALRDDGLLIMSAHNRAHAPLLRKAMDVRTDTPLRLAADVVRLPRRVRNARRLSPFVHEEPAYALLNDDAHDFSTLYYYVARDAQERQLEEHGFEPLECLDLEGNRLAPGDQAPESAELHYIARAR